MNIEEFSNEFDVLLNSHSFFKNLQNSSISSIELDEYEKSVFLTKAQEEIVLQLYKGNNTDGHSFEETEEIRRYLDPLLNTYETVDKVFGYSGMVDSSTFFRLPEDLLFITYESVTLEDSTLNCHTGKNVSVVPVTQDDFKKTYNNPFKRPSYKRVLRLDYTKGISELISDFNIYSYYVRYIKKPNPIILTELPYDLSINGKNTITDCELNPLLHRIILQKAIELVVIYYSNRNV